VATRTRETHPIEIAEIRAKPEFGRIGITLCPGKKDSAAMTGGWARDVAIDVAAIRQWGAAAVVTLIEDHEVEKLQVRGLGDDVRRNHMEWLHLPVRDVSTPSTLFTGQWEQVSEGVRARIRDGFDVVVHCKGGLGRAGMIAASLLVELGVEPERAISEARSVRPGAIQTAEQASFVRQQRFVPEKQPSTSAEAIEDRAMGALLGLAVGDAVGTTLEFKARDTYPQLTDMVGGGPFKLQPGQWTDDTAMALALADTLLERGDLNEQDLMARFFEWREKGTYSCTGRCFDIGVTTSAAVSRWKRTGEAHSGSTEPNTAGNGSLMRLSPVAVRYWRDRPKLRDVAARQSKTTHAAPEAVDGCVAFAEMIADAIEGKPRSEVLRARPEPYAGTIDQIVKGSWRGKSREEIRSSGYVAHSLEASVWSVGRTGDFRAAVLTAANLGDDADTTGAITGLGIVQPEEP
jgi:ADP-ribosyl-[dinitrogen reductase] hydrolase